MGGFSYQFSLQPMIFPWTMIKSGGFLWICPTKPIPCRGFLIPKRRLWPNGSNGEVMPKWWPRNSRRHIWPVAPPSIRSSREVRWPSFCDFFGTFWDILEDPVSQKFWWETYIYMNLWFPVKIFPTKPIRWNEGGFCVCVYHCTTKRLQPLHKLGYKPNNYDPYSYSNKNCI